MNSKLSIGFSAIDLYHYLNKASNNSSTLPIV